MTTVIDQQESKSRGPVQYWLGEIAAAQKREKDFRKDGRRILSIYNGEKVDSIPFNILFSNTETLLPALYNSTPRPQVDRRFKDDDPVGKSAAQVGQRTLEYLVDTNSDEYAPFDNVMVDAVLDALVPGRGASRVKYDYESGKSGATEVVTYETVCYESVKWDRWIFGYAKKWKKVPWVAFWHAVTKEEATELFGAEKAAALTYTSETSKDDDEKTDEVKNDTSDEQEQKTAVVWEIWDKAGGNKVRFVAEGYKTDYLKTDEDPLNLTGFFPMPEPLRFHRKANDLTVTAVYRLYENQAKELNRITVRINKIIEACKVRGVYDSTLGEIADLLKKDDNQLVPAENVAALQVNGLEKALWLMPIEKLIAVLQQLYVAREACKKTIYEITGISDILRGASAASETLGAQEIKQNWATLRLKRLQREVQRYARDMLRISLEIAANKFQIQTFKTTTNLQFPMAADKQAAQGAMARMQAQAQMAVQQAQATGQQPPPPPQPPQQLVQILSIPSWEEVVGLLRQSTLRQHRVDIETDSTIDLEATEDKKALGELMNAISQFLNGVGPMVESGALDINAAKGMLLYIVRKFRMGSDIEDYIKGMQPPKPKDDGKAAQSAHNAQIEQMKLQQKDAVDKGNAALAQQKEVHGIQLEQAKFQFEQAMETAKARQSHELEMEKIAANKVVELAKLQAQRVTEEMKARIQADTELKKATLAAETQIMVANISAKAATDNAETSAAASKETAAIGAEAKAAPAVAEGKQTAETAKIMTQILEGQGQLMEALSAPKDVQRDNDGKMLSIVPRIAKKAAK